MKKILLSISLLLSACSQQANEFDAVCNYFGELSEHKELDNASPTKRYEFINTKVKSLGETTNAWLAWDALSNTDEQRYNLFKEAAQSVNGKSWSCPTMSTLAPHIHPAKKDHNNISTQTGTTTMSNADWETKKTLNISQ